MDEFLKMDIFFVVTTLVVLAVGIVTVLILLRVWRILGHVERITQQISEESALLRQDIAHLRSNIQEEGFKVTRFVRFLLGAVGRFGKKSQRDE